MNSRKKQSRKKRYDNSAWTKSVSTRSSSVGPGNILHVRCDTTTGIKTSLLVNVDEVNTTEPVTNEQLARRIDRNLDERTYRPLASPQFNTFGSPVFARTPLGTGMYPDGSYGPFRVMSNRPSAASAYAASEQGKQMADFLTAIKSQRVTVTEEQQTAVQKERRKAGYKRKKSQNAEMGESAENHVTTHHVKIKNVRLEWAHLLAHSLVGAVGQQADNLVATTAHANTSMIFAEATLPVLMQRYPDGFDVEVTAYVLDGTDVAMSIDYKITTDDFEQTYVFDGQEANAPHISFKSYFHALTQALLATNADSPYAPRTRSVMTQIDPNTNFFSKKEERAKKARLSPEDEEGNELKGKKLF